MPQLIFRAEAALWLFLNVLQRLQQGELMEIYKSLGILGRGMNSVY